MPSEITWSLMHPTPLEPDYLARVLRKAAEYHVDSFELCGECHSPYGGLDGLIDYREYPAAHASWDQQTVAENRRRLNRILALAHAAGKAVYLWHREVMLPSGLLQDLPELLDDNGEFNLTGPAFAALLRYKLDKTFESVPELDGVVLTLTEADYSAIHNSDTRRYPPAAVVGFIIGIFAAELERRGKRFIMRSFGSIPEDYETILAGAESLGGRHRFEIETKITPYDFDPFLPINPFLKRSPGFTLSAECDCLGEFMGQGNMPFENVDNIVRYVRAGQAAGVDRFAIRLDRRGNCVFDLYEINYYAFARALEDEAVTAQQIRQEWQQRNYPAQFREGYAELDRIGWEMVCKTYFIDHHVLFHGNYCMKYLRAGFVFALFAEGRRTLANGRGIWSILTDRMTPGRAAILGEKDEAVVLADQGLALLERLNPPAADWRWQLWRNAVAITRAIRELVLCIIYYFDDMEWEKPEAPHLKAQVASSLAQLERLAGHPLESRRRKFVNGMEHRTNETNQTLEEVVLEPLATICRELPEEFKAEYAAREKYLAGCDDGLIAGGITDDWRIDRYMHASHAMLLHGIPARWAGNRVFPNGFFQVELKRGAELVIHGATDETRRFTLVCDGRRMPAELDAQGTFAMPLPPGGDKVTVRLEKDGAAYPQFYAVLTRSPGWENRPRIPLFVSRDTVMPKDMVPEPTFDQEPGLVELYYTAWQSAWTHIFSCRKAPVSPYMNEGVRCHKIWIWDTCFMALFCRYAAQAFPGIQSLDNFYRVMHDGEDTGLKIQIPDNPPLFAWAEYEYFKYTGDTQRVQRVLLEHRYLQRHYHWLNQLEPGVLFDFATTPTGAHLVPGKGFRWHYGKAGMDNSPRGDGNPASIYYLDLSCQQALSALCIARLAQAIGQDDLARQWLAEHAAQKELINRRFWSEEHQLYLDRWVDESGFCPVLTPASLWPLLAEVAEPRQAAAMAAAVADPGRLGGQRPLPSVSRDDPNFSLAGDYWRGSIWPPMAYMAVKGLARYGMTELADDIADKMVALQYRTWKDYEPHTIWECYSPTADQPGTNKVGRPSRPDFCGWSALGPVSLFIENLLGIREVDASQRRIVWDPRSPRPSGLRNLKMGWQTVSLVAHPESGRATIEATCDFTLRLHGQEIPCPAGTSQVPLPAPAPRK